MTPASQSSVSRRWADARVVLGGDAAPARLTASSSGGFPLLQGQQITVSALCRRPACPEGRSLNAYIHRLQLIGTAGEIPKAPPANQIRFVEDMDESELAQAVSAEAGQHLLLLEHQADRRRYGPIDIQMKIPAGLQNMGNTVRYRKRLSSPHGQLRPMLT